MNAPLLRRGACPSLAAPMQTGDGLLARLNRVEGGLLPAQLIGLARAAARHGNGIVEVTQRGSLQIRGLTAESALLLSAEINALGIAVRAGVPVETGPLAGLDPDEIADTRPPAEAIRSGIEAAGLDGRLGPKVSVVVDGGGRSGLDGVTADVRVTSVGDGRWQLAIAGNAATARPLAMLAGDKVAPAVVSLLEVVAGYGVEGRARDLAGEVLGRFATESAFEGAPPSVLPDISPSRGEISASRFLPLSNVTDEEARPKLPISPLEGEMAGRPEGGAREKSASLLGFHLLKDGRFAMAIALPFGNIHAADLIAFISEAHGATEIRLAPQRTLILLCPSETAAEDVQAASDRAGLVTGPADPRAMIAACAGSPACPSGHIPAREMAARIAASLPAALELHVSGCAKRCAKPGHDGLTLLGTPDGVALVLESAGRLPLVHVAGERGEAAIGRVAALVSAERKPGESAGACLNRIGAARLAKTFAREN